MGKAIEREGIAPRTLPDNSIFLMAHLCSVMYYKKPLLLCLCFHFFFQEVVSSQLNTAVLCQVSTSVKP